MDLLTGMEFDFFVPSFPQLQEHFGLSPSLVEALLSVNFIGYCLSLFFVGSLADRYGRKFVILSGLIIFAIGSIICLLTDSYSIFLVGRFLQGAGVAAPAILSFLIIADSYSLKEQQFLLAMLNGCMNVAVALAPVIGSYLTLYFNWRGNFVALFVLGLISLVMTIIFIPVYELPARKEALLLRGYALIFKSGPLMLLIICLLFIFVPYWIFAGMSPLLYLKNLGVSLKHFGYYQGVLALVFALGSVGYGFYIKHFSYDQKNALYSTIQIYVVSLIMLGLATLLNTTSPLFITLAMLVFVIGQIIPSTILYPLCLNLIPQAKGRVSAVIQGGRLVLSAVGLQIAGYFYQESFQSIGMVIIGFILVAVILSLFVINNNTLMSPPVHE
jgi:MFS transporter, DHA1 family, multidrug resistance protein